MRRELCIFAAAGLGAMALAQTRPAGDDTFEWLTKTHASTRPTTAPAAETSPLKRAGAEAESLVGTITMSDGTKLSGAISTTPGKPLRVWVEEAHQYVDFELSEVVSAAASVVWERDEKEWHFIASGSDLKEYTGRMYPARETAYSFKLADGRTVVGGIVAPLYVQTPAGQKMVVLQKRGKGPAGQKLEDLVYVKELTITGRSTP